MPNDRITLVEPYGGGNHNRRIPHGMSGEDAYELIKIHHPNANARAERSRDPDDMERTGRGTPRTGRVVEGAMEEVSFAGDRDGIPLVKKDLIMLDSRGSREVMIPNPVGGYVQFNRDSVNTISIWSGPPGDRNRELVGRVLHGLPGSSPYENGDYVPYGTPLVRQSNVGTGGVHAHIELEPDQYRRYLGDILNDRITFSRRPSASERPSPNEEGPAASREGAGNRRADGVLRLGSEGAQVETLQRNLAALGYRGADGRPLVPDGDFGRNTDHAVRAFQEAHDLKPVDGKVGPDTRRAMEQAQRHPLVSEAAHPSHALYAEIGRQLPPGTDPKAIANVTLQAMENGITSPAKLERMAVRGDDVYLQGTIPGDRVKVDLTAPTPDLQAMSNHMATQTQERAQAEQQSQRRQQEPQALAI